MGFFDNKKTQNIQLYPLIKTVGETQFEVTGGWTDRKLSRQRGLFSHCNDFVASL